MIRFAFWREGSTCQRRGIHQGGWVDGCDDEGEGGVYMYLDQREEPPVEGEGGE